MLSTYRVVGKWCLCALIFTGLIWVVLATVHRVAGTGDSVTLPNGMMFRREFDWALGPSAVLVATDGRTVLAREVEFACFNDRYVHVVSYLRAHSGLYDAEVDAMVPSDGMSVSGLRAPDGGCNGYYTGWVGPELILGGAKAPYLPPCGWRNTGNSQLKNRVWFGRACAAVP